MTTFCTGMNQVIVLVLWVRDKDLNLLTQKVRKHQKSRMRNICTRQIIDFISCRKAMLCEYIRTTKDRRVVIVLRSKVSSTYKYW